MRNWSIFVATCILEGRIFCLFAAGIFYALSLHIHGATPVSVLNGPTAFKVQVNGSVAPFFHATKQTLLSVMTCTEKKRLNGKTTSRSNRPAHETSESIGNKRRAVLLDNNVLASDFGLEQIEEIVRMGIAVDFSQGLDARRACDDPYILDLLSRVKWIRHIRFACDTRAQIEPVLKCIRELEQRGVNRHRFFVYCLVKEIDDALFRLNIFREMHINPFAQPYRDFDNKIRPTVEQRRVAHWCNKKSVFYSCEFTNFRL